MNTLATWKAYADMPTTDAFGNWYDLETGIYFDEKADIPIEQRLYQYWGKRVSFTERKDRKITVTILNSRLSLLAEKVIMRHQFDARPAGNNEQVVWACTVCGIALK